MGFVNFVGNFSTMEQIHIGKLIGEQVPPLMTKARLARLLGVTQPAATLMLKRETMQVNKLVLVSERLNYNFFRAIGEMLGIDGPSFAEATEGKGPVFAKASEDTKEKRIGELTLEADRLREENRYLKKAIDLIGPSYAEASEDKGG